MMTFRFSLGNGENLGIPFLFPQCTRQQLQTKKSDHKNPWLLKTFRTQLGKQWLEVFLLFYLSTFSSFWESQRERWKREREKRLNPVFIRLLGFNDRRMDGRRHLSPCHSRDQVLSGLYWGPIIGWGCVRACVCTSVTRICAQPVDGSTEKYRAKWVSDWTLLPSQLIRIHTVRKNLSHAS